VEFEAQFTTTISAYKLLFLFTFSKNGSASNFLLTVLSAATYIDVMPVFLAGGHEQVRRLVAC
jgi:hypothetical protein